MQLHRQGDQYGQLKLLKAINALRTQQPEAFRILEEGLRREQAFLDKQLRRGEGVALHQAQGHAQRIEELLDFFDNARDLQKQLLNQQRH